MTKNARSHVDWIPACAGVTAETDAGLRRDGGRNWNVGIGLRRDDGRFVARME